MVRGGSGGGGGSGHRVKGQQAVEERVAKSREPRQPRCTARCALQRYVIRQYYVHVTRRILLPPPLPREEKLEPPHKRHTHRQNAQALPHMPPRRIHPAQDTCHRHRHRAPSRPAPAAAAVPATTPRQSRPGTRPLPDSRQQQTPPRKHPPDTHEIQGREPLADAGSVCQHYRSSERIRVEPQGRRGSRRRAGVPGCVGGVGGCEAGRC